jgi:A/G-specific adenine glycosylase
MLQQTRVETVIPYWSCFLDAFPTVHALAEAPLDLVLAQWSGLGYYRRARLLHRGAQAVVGEHGGRLPSSSSALRSIPGIGPYTAGAVASIAFGEAAPLVDGNVARVLARVFAMDRDVKSSAGSARLWALAGELAPGEDPGAWNQALMELGATVCTPRAPACERCPAAHLCAAKARGLTGSLPVVGKKAPPKAWYRAAIVAERGTKLLLGRRRPDLPFGGLWEPPGMDLTSRQSRLPESLFGTTFTDLGKVGRIEHVLTHRRMTVTVWKGKVRGRTFHPDGTDYDRLELVDPRGSGLASLGISTLARKILALAHEAVC